MTALSWNFHQASLITAGINKQWVAAMPFLASGIREDSLWKCCKSALRMGHGGEAGEELPKDSGCLYGKVTVLSPAHTF